MSGARGDVDLWSDLRRNLSPKKNGQFWSAVALNSRSELEEELEELAALADTAGAEVVGVLTQTRKEIDPAYFIGQGKAEELARMCSELSADLVIFNHDLTPAQARKP
jgi:GTP-binding protein HflX